MTGDDRHRYDNPGDDDLSSATGDRARFSVSSSICHPGTWRNRTVYQKFHTAKIVAWGELLGQG